MFGNKEENLLKHPNFAIIGSFNFFAKENILKLFVLIFFTNIKIFIYKFYKKKKIHKLIEQKKILKLTHGCKIYGHKALLLSLLRGFNNLGMKYTYNKITKHTKYVILLWADKKDLAIVEKYKKKQKLKVVTVPTACKLDYNYMQWQFPHEEAVDMALYASQWVANIAIDKANGCNIHKIKVWPSGVEIPNISYPKKSTNNCVVYFKKLPVNKSLLKLLDDMRINYHIIEYGKYAFHQWKELLKQSDFVIFYQDCQETQGLALAEAWAYNLPTFVKTMVKNQYESPSPYLCSDNGDYFENLEELKSLLNKYKKDPDLFLSKFSPRKYIVENMSDVESVKILLRIFNDI